MKTKERLYNNHTTDNQNNKEATAEILFFSYGFSSKSVDSITLRE